MSCTLRNDHGPEKQGESEGNDVQRILASIPSHHARLRHAHSLETHLCHPSIPLIRLDSFVDACGWSCGCCPGEKLFGPPADTTAEP